jgi:hypothetical protein
MLNADRWALAGVRAAGSAGAPQRSSCGSPASRSRPALGPARASQPASPQPALGPSSPRPLPGVAGSRRSHPPSRARARARARGASIGAHPRHFEPFIGADGHRSLSFAGAVTGFPERLAASAEGEPHGRRHVNPHPHRSSISGRLGCPNWRPKRLDGPCRHGRAPINTLRLIRSAGIEACRPATSRVRAREPTNGRRGACRPGEPDQSVVEQVALPARTATPSPAADWLAWK